MPRFVAPSALLPIACLALAFCPHAVSADTPRIVREVPLDREMLRANENFGYTEAEIETLFSAPLALEYDYTGFAHHLVKTPPPAGVHPRVLFHPEDLPDLRRRLAAPGPNQLMMDRIRTTLATLLTGPSARHATVYADAIAGVENPQITDVEPACAIIYENFRALLDEDAKGAKKAAAALVTLARMSERALDAAYARDDAKRGGQPPRLRDYQAYRNETYSGLLGLGYDFAFNTLNDEQRAVVRSALVKASSGMTAIGCEALPALPANVSNWIPMHMPMLFLVSAIEGEPGYDAATYRRFVSGYQRYLGVSLFPSGEMFESMGKNFLCAQNLLLIGNRGDNLIALRNIRAQVANYYLHAMDPWGGRFTFFDSLGGRGNVTPMQDVMVVKRMFPHDPAIDFVYRNSVGEDYAFFKQGVRFGHPIHLGDMLMRAIYGVPYDESKSFEQAMRDATRGRSPTYYSDDTGNLITRTAWTTDATVLHLLTRAVAGGHVYADRGNFNLLGLGRHWAIYKPMRQIAEHYAPRNRSVILIDGEGPGLTPAKSVAFEDTALSTFAAVDVKPAFDWTTGGNNRKPKRGVPPPFTGNDFRLHQSPLPWMNIPWGDLPHWQTSRKGSELWLARDPVRRAFRTAGLVRGKHPYVLVVDDIQKDDLPRAYDWGMILEDDLELVSRTGPDTLIGEGKTGPDARFLLLRILQAEGADPSTPALDSYELPNGQMQPISLKRLSLRAHSVAPQFKVLLFPHREGAELPRTRWNADRSRLTVTWSDQEDTIEFTPHEDGRTRVRVTRS